MNSMVVIIHLCSIFDPGFLQHSQIQLPTPRPCPQPESKVLHLTAPRDFEHREQSTDWDLWAGWTLLTPPCGTLPRMKTQKRKNSAPLALIGPFSQKASGGHTWVPLTFWPHRALAFQRPQAVRVSLLNLVSLPCQPSL